MSENKISRICWNTQGWRKPSGSQGKSENKKAYEYRFGFGHEEWLLDTTKLIGGWHYAFLQPIGLHRDKYHGQKFNVSLYSINDDTKTRWWVGRIVGLEVVDLEESSKVYSKYKQKGWLKEMEWQVGSVGANVEEFRAIQPESFAVIKYRPDSLDLLDAPLEFAANDPVIRANYYVLLNQKQQPRLPSRTGKLSFVPGHNQKKASAKSSYEAHSGDIDLVHNTIQTAIYRQLIKTYGRKNVGTELDAGNGSKIDVVVHDNDGKFIFFEIKTSYSVGLCLREAVGQLLEYAYFPEKSNVKKLIVVSPNRITPEIRAYIRKVRSLFGIPLYYQRYAPEREALEDTMD